MCVCAFKLKLFVRQWAKPSDNLGLHKLASVKCSRRKVQSRYAKRAWCDSLVYSNIVYALAAFISFSCDQIFCGVLQMGAAIASTMFHRSKETKFLLLDALISGTLGIIFIFTGKHTLTNERYGVLSMILSLGLLCVFTWIYCGMPGGERYDKWHKRWHYVSGATTISTTLFLTMYVPEFDLLMQNLIQDTVEIQSIFV